jgi:hypothetical protein
MKLLEVFDIKTHPQYLTGRKFLQVGKDNSVKSYMSDIPTLSLLALLDLDRAMKRVSTTMMSLLCSYFTICRNVFLLYF